MFGNALNFRYTCHAARISALSQQHGGNHGNVSTGAGAG
jgi:hypothetical protein